MEAFDLIVIGAGPGGYVAAIRAAQLGLRVALVEKESLLGGTCLRVGCIPSKALLESSELYETARRRFADHGLRVTELGFDLATMMERKDRVVKELTSGIALLMRKNKVQVIKGEARLVGAGRVEVSLAGSKQSLEADAVLLATGSVPVELPGLPFDGHRIVSSTEALSFDEVPRRMVVVGAGAVGLELGSVWRRLGAEVTVVELLPQIVPFADATAAQLLKRSLTEQGLAFRLKSKVIEAAPSQEGLAVTVEDHKGTREELSCDRLLVAVGRRPCTQGLALEELGVKLDGAGRVAVSSRWETSLSGVYAIGDLTAGPCLAHKAEEEGVAVAEVLAGQAGHVNYDAIPSVVYTDPELAQVGLTEKQAKERGLPIRTGKFYFKANGRAKSMGTVEGMVKLIAHAETDRLLGAHIVGPHASDLVAELVVAVEFEASAEDLARTVHAHPTLSEAVKEAALAVAGRAIHA
jgi:dihydrolipoamide dehydrogenase